MFDPSSLRNLIYEHGTTVTLRKKTTGAYNASTGKATQTNTDYSVKAYFFNDDPSIGEFNTHLKGERRVLVADILTSGTTTPEIDATDEVIFGTKTTTVTRVTQISSNGQRMCQMLYVRD